MKKKNKIILIVAAALAVVLAAGGVLFALLRPPVVLSFGSASVRQPVYDYWVACYKYAFLATYRQEGIEDSAAGWAKQNADGESYDSLFTRNIDKTVRRRLIAASLYDAAGGGLSSSFYSALQSTLDNMGYYEEEDVYRTLRTAYGVNRRGVYQVAVFEAKYLAYREMLFGEDYQAVYGEEYREALDAFYRENCLRFRLIYIPDEKGADQATVEAAFRNGVSEDTFRTFAENYNNLPTLAENYPNGIYVCTATANILSDFDSNIASAVSTLQAPGDTATVPNEVGTGKFYLLRCDLPKEGYRSETIPGFAEAAVKSLYPTVLNRYLDEVKDGKGTPVATMTAVKACRDYNIVKILSNSAG